ncbi:MAG: GNAT family N-acetyltransferase [Thermoanaerobaculia bacterium]
MIRTAGPNDLPALRALFARANDAPYDLAAVAEEKCFGLGIAGAPVVRVVDENGVIHGAAVICGKWLRILAVTPESRRKGIGTALLQDAEAHGATVIAAEPGNYFTPGVPMEDEGARAFFEARGYSETRSTWNLDVTLTGNVIEHVRRPEPADADRVLAYVEREFGRIWQFEVAKAFDHELPVAFIAEEHGAITGFAVHDVNNRGLGWFGPTGVAKELRGRGIGARLLEASLDDLRRLGYERAIIPWTDALDFYAKASGAKPAHRFVAFARRHS